MITCPSILTFLKSPLDTTSDLTLVGEDDMQTHLVSTFPRTAIYVIDNLIDLIMYPNEETRPNKLIETIQQGKRLDHPNSVMMPTALGSPLFLLIRARKVASVLSLSNQIASRSSIQHLKATLSLISSLLNEYKELPAYEALFMELDSNIINELALLIEDSEKICALSEIQSNSPGPLKQNISTNVAEVYSRIQENNDRVFYSISRAQADYDKYLETISGCDDPLPMDFDTFYDRRQEILSISTRNIF
ncbi:uncharacterized protein NDAI_0I01530 [Naumovozyma dairenensis CBS 421]|uniref:Uncharacterized protein n=1 Tax=Naumovozyma dairenensis (strain ATCC 10597 / BCRC 20456 / CBS 421 / NBRC 0211 / NRRL Y-12639) TaxID=1071378 RepID=G0WG11_NAUDC|nr:hypothetical protein NDAI_0I01530 [Naumovozyma dairenensis CBS 421]CCD26722.1 hypothetical protein NDAI_0I01530 [Naumovozyma dairenensis CBS 421]